MRTTVFTMLYFLIASSLYGQAMVDRELWQQTQAAAQKIGLCVYMQNLPDDQCTCLQSNGDQSYMKPLGRGWARTRMMKWMMKRGQLPQGAILVYDRYTTTSSSGGELNKSYFIFGKDEVTLSYNVLGEDRYSMIFQSKEQKKAILNNTYWREFFMKKEGRALDIGRWSFHGVKQEDVKVFVNLMKQVLNQE